MNHVVLVGLLTSTPQHRILTSGAVLWSLEVSTMGADGTRWSVPVAWFDPPMPLECSMGDEVVVIGAVRRRFFRGAQGTQSRTEVVASSVTPLVDRRRCRRLLRAAAERLGAAATGELPSA